MSVLSLPRIHFFGSTDWDPSTANNSSTVYDEASVEPMLQPGVTYATFLNWLKSMDPVAKQPKGSWNIYGNHACSFTESKITGAQLVAGAAPSGDALIGKGLDLQGLVYSDGPAPARMVMTDPFTGGEATSQIFYQWLVVGVVDGPPEQRVGFKAAAASRIFSRWPDPNRNLGITFKEGMKGCAWQAAAHNKDIQWYGVDRSPSLAALKAAATSGGNQGILMRFASYRTLYYQAAIYKGKRILNGEELVAAYLDGFTGANPARSAMLGSIGVWEAGELASAPTGRLLAPASPAQLVKSSATASLGPAMVKVDSKRNVLVVDFISAFPEKNEQLDKADFGPLKLQARDASGNVIHIASLPYGAYDRHAYESTGGISEFPLPAGGIGAGAIELVQEQAKKPVAILSQSRFVAETDDWGVYVDQGQTVPVRIKVTENGGPPGPGVKLLLKEYNSDGNFAVPPDVQVCDAAGKPVTDGIVPVVNGEALLSVRSIQPGACFLAFYPFVGAPPTSIPTANFPLPTSFYCCIRMLPFDDELERTTPDSQLSWSFLYTKVLRVFDLIYPVMSLVRNLHDRNVVEAMGEQLKFAVSLDTFESTLYMPITRDLSAGKRKLLQRFVNLLPNRVPPDPPGQP